MLTYATVSKYYVLYLQCPVKEVLVICLQITSHIFWYYICSACCSFLVLPWPFCRPCIIYELCKLCGLTLFEIFPSFSYVLGAAADCWLVYMDRLLTCEVQEDKKEWESIKAKMLELVDIYYEALDAPKSGNKVWNPVSIYTIVTVIFTVHLLVWD